MSATITTKVVVECPECEGDNIIDVALDSGDVFDCERCDVEFDVPPPIDFINHFKEEAL